MATVAKKFRKGSAGPVNRDEEEKIEQIDFKMVTFSLAGKDYGIDIMKVKEIARFVNFTYVPNTPPFVRGVYNLRGEIISIIDLRGMFNLPHEQGKDGEEESGLILRLESNLIGVVVDKIDKVIGINSDYIQPPHPIFGDINIKFISGVVENEGRLYIILDVEKILGKPDEQSAKGPVPMDRLSHPESPKTQEVPKKKSSAQAEDSDELTMRFIGESLAALEGFHLSSLNRTWFEKRFHDWKEDKKTEELQIKSNAEAEAFLRPFASPNSGRLWDGDYAERFISGLPSDFGNQIQVWNPGCGKGYETYCITAALRKKFPNSSIRVWASDKDLLNISAAPSLSFQQNEVPDWLRGFMVEGKGGLSFNQQIKDSILFEYHDITNTHNMPPVQLTVARDLFSFLTVEQAREVLLELKDRKKGESYLCLGQNELGNLEFGLEPIQGNPIGLSRLAQ